MRIFPVRFGSIQKMLDFYSQFNPSPLSIKQFIDFGKKTQQWEKTRHFINLQINNFTFLKYPMR